MRYIKLYEELTPKVGDYVICHITEGNKDEQPFTDNFLNNNIGKIVNLNPYSTKRYFVKFENNFDHYSDYSELSNSFENNILNIYYDEIVHFSSSKEEMELYIHTKKYNL